MAGSQEDEELSAVNEELNRKLNDLTKDWNSYKQSHPRRRNRFRRCSTDVKSTVKIARLLDSSSPRHQMITSVQRNKKPNLNEWKVRNNDLAVIEILGERRAAMESGKLKGRRLMEALESASTMGLSGKQEMVICSTTGSSDLIQNGEVRFSDSSSFSSSFTDDNGEGDESECVCGSCHSSSSSVDKDEKAVVAVQSGIEFGNGGKWVVPMGWLAVVLVLFVVCMVSLWRFFCEEEIYEHEEAWFPT